MIIYLYQILIIVTTIWLESIPSSFGEVRTNLCIFSPFRHKKVPVLMVEAMVPHRKHLGVFLFSLPTPKWENRIWLGSSVG